MKQEAQLKKEKEAKGLANNRPVPSTCQYKSNKTTKPLVPEKKVTYGPILPENQEILRKKIGGVGKNENEVYKDAGTAMFLADDNQTYPTKSDLLKSQPNVQDGYGRTNLIKKESDNSRSHKVLPVSEMEEDKLSRQRSQ